MREAVRVTEKKYGLPVCGGCEKPMNHVLARLDDFTILTVTSDGVNYMTDVRDTIMYLRCPHCDSRLEPKRYWYKEEGRQ